MLAKIAALYKKIRQSVAGFFLAFGTASIEKPVPTIAAFLAVQIGIFVVSATWPLMGLVIFFSSLALCVVGLHGIACGDLNEFIEPVPASTNA